MVDAVGLISLGITACQGLLTYYGRYKSYSEDTNNILRRISSLREIFQALHDVLADTRAISSSTSAEALRRIVDCEDGINQLETTLSTVTEHESGSSSRARFFDRALYPFRRAALLELSNTTRELQDNMNTALHLLGISLGLATGKQIALLGEASTNIATDTRQTLALIQKIDHRHDNCNDALVDLANKIDGMHLTISHYGTRLPEPSTVKSLISQHQQVDQALGGLATQLEPRRRQSRRVCICFSYGQPFFGHREGCRFHPAGEKLKVIKAEYVFCTRFLAFSVRIAFGITTGAGGFSIGHHLKFQTMVANSPVINLLRSVESEAYRAGGLCRDMKAFEPFIRDCFINMLRMFKDREVSPTDIDIHGNTVAHHIASILGVTISSLCFYVTRLESFLEDILRGGLPQLIQVLQLGKMHLNSPNSEGRLPSDILIMEYASFIAPLRKKRLDHKFLRLWQLFWGEIDYLSLGLSGENESQLFQKLYFYETFKDSIPVEDILASEPLEPLVNRDAQLLASKIEKGLNMPLFLYAFWTEGFQKLFNAGYKLGQHNLVDVCCTGRIDAISNILSTKQFYLDKYVMTSIVCKCTPEVIQLVIIAFRERRKRLQELAERYLPGDILQGLQPKPNTLLGFQASRTYKLLKAYHVEFDDIESPEGWVVYMSINNNPMVADMLWDAGFQDIDETDSEGFTTLMAAKPPIMTILAYSSWLIRKGADIHFRKDNIPALHHLAYNVWWPGLFYGGTGFTGAEERTMRLILEDDCQDSCDCACSEGGRYAVTLFWRHLEIMICLRVIFYGESLLDGTEIPSLLNNWIMSGLQTSFNRHAVAILRAVTFGVLGIPHTCRHWEEPDPDGVQDSMDNVALLEELMLELVPKYEASNKGILGFLRDEWFDRMKEVLDQPVDEENIRRVRELGVVLERSPLEMKK